MNILNQFSSLWTNRNNISVAVSQLGRVQPILNFSCNHSYKLQKKIQVFIVVINLSPTNYRFQRRKIISTHLLSMTSCPISTSYWTTQTPYPYSQRMYPSERVGLRRLPSCSTSGLSQGSCPCSRPCSTSGYWRWNQRDRDAGPWFGE